jgi:hypothetical protein
LNKCRRRVAGIFNGPAGSNPAEFPPGGAWVPAFTWALSFFARGKGAQQNLFDTFPPAHSAL